MSGRSVLICVVSALILTLDVSSSDAISLGKVFVDELFAKKIEPHMFNWTFAQPEHFQYRASLKGYPDLPSWMRYMFSDEYATGYLYGTPPAKYAGREVKIDIVALNRLSYETKRLTLSLVVTARNLSKVVNTVQMKIENLNWVHLMDPGRVENLKNIFRQDLWPESKGNLHIVFMDSAIAMGGRIPLRPQQMEGVIIYLGSVQPFSRRLSELQEEIRPLYKLTTCSYKRTSVQTIFESAGFKIDWCAFRIVEGGSSVAASSNHHQPTTTTPSTTSKDHSTAAAGDHSMSDHSFDHHTDAQRHIPAHMVDIRNAERLEFLHRDDVPQRNYIDELAFVIAVPGIILTLFVAVLIIVLCFRHEKMEPMCQRPAVQMVQYSDESNNPVTTTTLKSLKDPIQQLADDGDHSLRSHSPCNSLGRVDTSVARVTASSTMRPRPPPYKPPSSAHTLPRHSNQIAVDRSI